MLLSELLDRTERSREGCLEWTGPADRKGYGRLWVEGRKVGAHRLAYFLTHGAWPEVCRHTCDNPPCINPDHLLDGTHLDNMRDARERGRFAGRRRTVSRAVERKACPKGHPYDDLNDYRCPGSGRRQCRVCNADRQRRWRRKQLAT